MRIFIFLISKHSTKSHYQNFQQKTNKYNKKIQPKSTESQKSWKCFFKEDCPISGLCWRSNILYQATVKSNSSKCRQKRCKEICQTNFKNHYTNQKQSFNLNMSKHDASLVIALWTTKTSSPKTYMGNQRTV